MKHIRNRFFLISDIIFLIAIPFVALFLRVNPADYKTFMTQDFMIFVIIALLIKLPVFYAFKLYARYWRYASIEEMISIVWAVAIPAIILTGLVGLDKVFAIFPVGYGVPRSLPILDAILTFIVIAGTRFSPRLAPWNFKRTIQHIHHDRKRVLILGAGGAGVILLRSMRSDPGNRYDVVGFLDDDTAKHNLSISGVLVLGTISELPQVAEEYDIDEAIIAFSQVSGQKSKEIFELCERADVTVKVLPNLSDIIGGQVNISKLREINLEDLLRRNPVKLNYDAVVKMLSGKTVMVTGAGGSIGSEICRQIAGCGPEKLLLLGHGENSLFSISNELIRKNPYLKIEILVVDIRDRKRMENIYRRFNPEIVFHAAAHKHVPMMEMNVEEAVTNNVMGTRTVVELAEKYGVERFVTISSDKAVNPTNVMGTTKRITELIVRAAGFRTEKPFVSVRFGNVLGSRGSVVPLFKKQIDEGGPITVTHAEMTRFFMTIPEATQLVLQAGAMGTPGDVFVLDMGEPVKIVDMANDLIKLSGFKPGVDIPIKFTGLRPGEKMHEELFGGQEDPVKTEHAKIFRAPNQELLENLDSLLDELIGLAKEGDKAKVLTLLQKIVPEFNHSR